MRPLAQPVSGTAGARWARRSEIAVKGSVAAGRRYGCIIAMWTGGDWVDSTGAVAKRLPSVA